MPQDHRETISAMRAEIPRLRRFARYMTRDADYADDLVQECLTRAIANIASWQPGTNFSGLAFRHSEERIPQRQAPRAARHRLSQPARKGYAALHRRGPASPSRLVGGAGRVHAADRGSPRGLDADRGGGPALRGGGERAQYLGGNGQVAAIAGKVRTSRAGRRSRNRSRRGNRLSQVDAEKIANRLGFFWPICSSSTPSPAKGITEQLPSACAVGGGAGGSREHPALRSRTDCRRQSRILALAGHWRVGWLRRWDLCGKIGAYVKRGQPGRNGTIFCRIASCAGW